MYHNYPSGNEDYTFDLPLLPVMVYVDLVGIEYNLITRCVSHNRISKKHSSLLLQRLLVEGWNP